MSEKMHKALVSSDPTEITALLNVANATNLNVPQVLNVADVDVFWELDVFCHVSGGVSVVVLLEPFSELVQR